MPTTLPPPVRRALSRLEKRLLWVLGTYGAGQVAAAAVGLLAALYVLDRLFVPPAPVRAVLSVAALGVLAILAYRCLWRALRRRPRQRDLAALWERSHPELQDRLATTVELSDAPAGTSPDLLALVAAEASQLAARLEPARAVPSGRARRSALGGAAAVGALAALAFLVPTEAGIFLQRLLGREVPWPQDTHLVLLTPHADGGEAPPMRQAGTESYELQAARGSVLTVRVRAEGEVPERVLALGIGPPRPMRPLGDGEFVLRLAPLQEAVRIHFRGGDDDDGLPRLLLEPGIAPAVVDWSVQVEPPAYTGFLAETSSMNEFRVPHGTRLSARFTTRPPAATVTARALNGAAQELAPGPDGFYALERTAEGSAEVLVAVAGRDGFEDTRAAVLRWHAQPDRPPRLEFQMPAENWTTVEGGGVPVLLYCSDEFGLAEALLAAGPWSPPAPLALQAGQRELRHFIVLEAPAGGAAAAEPTATARFRLEAWARDNAEPDSHETKAQSAWIEVVAPETYEQRLAERMVAVRERVERIRDAVLLFEVPAASGSESPLPRSRRLRRDLESLHGELERVLTERLYTRLDRASEPALERLQSLFQAGPAAPGAVTAALAGGLPPLERSGLLLDLSRAAGVAREGPAAALLQAVTEQKDPAPAARELHAELDAMLDILLAWEDFQSAVNLLRNLLERQSSLYLRTQEASTR
ncbi:MAG: hypothetical protein EYC70_06815 [Planctomycetota bacterium]|nr:MAG: hypothetical protein EYC70_06815 [Planctomycetota bacterium]